MAHRTGLQGLVPTAFKSDETLDLVSFRAAVEMYVAGGCTGVVVLGLLGEASRLSESERRSVVDAAVDQAAGRVPVTVGVAQQSSLLSAVEACQVAAAGGHAVMLPPPVRSRAGDALSSHFRRVVEATGLPVVLHDHPAATGVVMPAAFIVPLMEKLPPGSVVKVEEAPSLRKIDAIRRISAEVSLVGGLNGRYLPDELDAGIRGWITGFPYPELLVGAIAAYLAGNGGEARRIYREALPLILFESEASVCLAVRKEILCRRKAIASARRRAPSEELPDALVAALHKVAGDAESCLREVELRGQAATIPSPRSC